MEKKWNKINTVAKIIIPQKDKTQDELLENLNSVSSKEIKEIGNDIECKQVMEKFKHNRWEVRKEDFYLLIDNGYLSFIWDYIEYFNSYCQKDIAIRVIKKAAEEWRSRIREYLENFSYLDNDAALAMIKWGYANVVYYHIDSFSNLWKDAAIALYKETWDFESLKHFKESDREDISFYYIEQWNNDINLWWYIKCNKDLADKILKLNNENKFRVICKNIEAFPDDEHKEIALNIIKEWWASTLLEWIGWFTWMDKEVALALAEHDSFTSNLKLFAAEDRQEIALNLLDHWYKPSLEDVPKLNLDFANKLIEKGLKDYLINNIQYFFERDHKAIALAILDSWHFLMHESLKKFKWKDKELVLKLFEHANSYEPDTTNTELKAKNKKYLIEYVWEYVADNPNEFTWLDDEIATMLIDMGLWDKVKRHKKLYKELSTFTKMRLLIK